MERPSEKQFQGVLQAEKLIQKEEKNFEKLM